MNSQLAIVESMGKKVISLFAGAGGMDIGFHQAGFETAVAVEFDPACCKTLRKNMPSVPVIEGDISKIATSQILSTAGLRPLEAAVVVGGPPCQSFSLAGKRMGMDDPRGRLVLEFIRVVREALPVAFVMENVKGMVNWANGKALQAIVREATQPILHGKKHYRYTLSVQVLNAVDYGAPQFRERVFIVGNRLGIDFRFPNATHHCVRGQYGAELFESHCTPWRTVGETILGLPPASPPSPVAVRVSATIHDRIANHGY